MAPGVAPLRPLNGAASPHQDISPPPQRPANAAAYASEPQYYPGPVKAALAAARGGAPPVAERSAAARGGAGSSKYPGQGAGRGKAESEAMLAREYGYDTRTGTGAGPRAALPGPAPPAGNGLFGAAAAASPVLSPPFALTGKRKTHMAAQIYSQGPTSKAAAGAPSKQASYAAHAADPARANQHAYTSTKVSAVAAAAVALLPRAREGPAPWHLTGSDSLHLLKANKSAAWGRGGEESPNGPASPNAAVAFGRSTIVAEPSTARGEDDFRRTINTTTRNPAPLLVLPPKLAVEGVNVTPQGLSPGRQGSLGLSTGLRGGFATVPPARAPAKASPERGRPPEHVTFVHAPDMRVVGASPISMHVDPMPARMPAARGGAGPPVPSRSRQDLDPRTGRRSSSEMGPPAVPLDADRVVEEEEEMAAAEPMRSHRSTATVAVEDDSMEWEPLPGPRFVAPLLEQSSVFEEPMAAQGSMRWARPSQSTKGGTAESSATALRYPNDDDEERLEVEEDEVASGARGRPPPPSQGRPVSDGVAIGSPPDGDGMWSARGSTKGRALSSREEESDSFDYPGSMGLRSEDERRELGASGEEGTSEGDRRTWSESGTMPADDDFDETREEEESEETQDAAPAPAPHASAVAAPMLDPASSEELARLHSKYEVLSVVGEGAYGLVMRCGEKSTRRQVAIKEFKINDKDADAEDVRRTARREVRLLRELQHPNVVQYLEDFTIGGRTFIVMEFVPRSVLELLESSPVGPGLPKPQVKSLMYQLIQAITFLHSKSVLYRDIKPENLLVEDDGTLKLCDFGFARYVSGPEDALTDYVATRWYRAPELLLGPPFWTGSKQVRPPYSQPVDLWAVGCLMGELVDGQPLFPGDSDLDQLYRIVQMIGPLPEKQMGLFRANPSNEGIEIPGGEPLTLAARYGAVMDPLELDLMARLLEMDPAKRISGEECLAHPYFAAVEKTEAVAAAVPVPVAGQLGSPERSRAMRSA